jgi:long-subunit fatty acid transport protein
VALTYYSSIEHNLSTTESVGGSLFYTTTDVETPQSVKLDFQTGVAPKTLVFGYIRWTDWTQFNVTPPVFGEVTGGLPLVAYESDVWTYNIGVGRQLTDRLAGAFSITYEPDTNEAMPTLAPYDGQLLATLALSYDMNPWNISGGVTFGKLGDARNAFDTDFNDGSIWGAGVRASYNF